MSQKLGVILPPAAAPQLLAGEKNNSQRSGQIDLSPLQGFHGQAVGKPLQRGKRLRSPSRALMKKRTIPNRYRSFFRALPGLESSMSTLRSGPHGKFQKQKGIRICSGLYRSFILYAHDRGTRLYWAGLCRWGGGTGGF